MRLNRREVLRGGIAVGLSAAMGKAEAIPYGPSLPSNVVKTRSGAVRGYFANGGIFVFKGVPYGMDTAMTRFAAPKPVAAWSVMVFWFCARRRPWWVCGVCGVCGGAKLWVWGASSTSHLYVCWCSVSIPSPSGSWSARSFLSGLCGPTSGPQDMVPCPPRNCRTRVVQARASERIRPPL